nr:ParB [Cloning vector pDW25]QAT79468.1 ParB [Cloning vector pDW36]
MARGNNKDGFSIDSIVKTNPVVSSPDQKNEQQVFMQRQIHWKR